MKKVET